MSCIRGFPREFDIRIIHQLRCVRAMSDYVPHEPCFLGFDNLGEGFICIFLYTVDEETIRHDGVDVLIQEYLIGVIFIGFV